MSFEDIELPELMFEVNSPINCIIRTTTYHWFSIRNKHPNHDFYLDDVVLCLQNPYLITKSSQDSQVFLSYKKHGKYWLTVVSKKLNGYGFVITLWLIL